MESSLVSMYAFRLNPRESSYVLDRLLESGRIHAEAALTPSLFIQMLKDMLEQHPMFYEMSVRIVSMDGFPAEMTEIPSSFPYMFLFGAPVPNGASLEEIQDIYHSNTMFQCIRLLRRLFRERLGLHLQFTSENAGLWSGHVLPEVPFVRPMVDLMRLA
jgi:hypothetical protein